MILYDQPREVRFRGRTRVSSHMASDLLDGGTAELLVFGKRIGLRERWLQHRGEDCEHFDLFDGAIERAIKAGAKLITPREFIHLCVKPKRIHMVREHAAKAGLQVLVRSSVGFGEVVLKRGDEVVLVDHTRAVLRWLMK